MKSTDYSYLSVMIISFVIALFLTWKFWPKIRERLSKSKSGRILLGTRRVRGGFSSMTYLILTVLWLILAMIGLLILNLIFK